MVNDEIVSLMILQQILERSISVNPDNISTAENGKIAFEKSKTTNFDLILMDLNMPVMNGFEATILIRETQKPYIVALSASIIDQNLR